MITLDESHWPLAIFTSNGSLSDAQFDEYLQSYGRVLARRQRYVVLFDARKARPLDVGQVKKQAKWIDDHAKEIAERNIGIAFVIPSPMIRGVLKAIFWMRPMPSPHTVCQTMEEGLTWTRQQLVRAGMPVPNIADVA